MTTLDFIISAERDVGFREGPKGTHTSRTIMVAELDRVLRAGALGEELESAVLDENILEKATTSGRSLTLQRLRELYGLDSSIPLFRTLSSLWAKDPKSLPLLAVLAALARDPLLRATAKPVVSLANGAELIRDSLRDAVSAAVGSRLNAATLDKVIRNASSSWAQSGHLVGRTFKRRVHVAATPAAMAFAVWLAQAAGFTGEDILSSGWVAVLDLDPAERKAMLERARAAGLIDVRQLGSGLEIDASRLSGLRAPA
ncbi:hypothetical protein [Sinorhizobium medicae]|uniref:hypothetical protein n=1 Tax=Sinorhizobium medicae TaxID=110321 RepID=UPI00067E7AE6|nr:hypothetical protein [Sinorhizobium medicae]MDX0695441.1 hypothetical protein [Sinorhizobium medicae]MDX0744963.1 hypothetical protein [Sinorhizobium medicae]